MIKLYHGSNVSINKLTFRSLARSRTSDERFYLSADEQQAWERAYAAITLWGGVPQVTVFEFDEQVMLSDELNVMRFEAYTEAWADFIFANRDRRKPAYHHDYDIVYGPIANDKVGEQVALFKGGYINKERFLQKLQHMRGITFQYAFCTESAILKLKKL